MKRTFTIIALLTLSACASTSTPDTRACLVSLNGECLQHSLSASEPFRLVLGCPVR